MIPKEETSNFINPNICAICKRTFEMGITVWRLEEGWVHPECARKKGRKLE